MDGFLKTKYRSKMSAQTLTLPAFAKINLSLRVLGKRADGYHELDTIFQTINLHDTITLTSTENPEITLWCDDRSLPTGPHNLVWRAATSLRQHFALNKGARIRLEKRIPVQAGLGGGSADAAVTLIGLTYLWQVNASVEDLLNLAANIGADVSFFLFGGTAQGTGLGNDIQALPDDRGRYLLVVKPNAGISTAHAYEALRRDSLTSAGPKFILSSSPRSEIFDSFHAEAPHNDFEPAVFGLAPETERVRVALGKSGAKATLLAGSGSAVFGVFDNQDAQRRAIQAIELEAGWRVFLCRTVARNEYRTAMGAAGSILSSFDHT
jgi:4-diphosphocytidyl-2-C-methyl-D-erythritol kinase